MKKIILIVAVIIVLIFITTRDKDTQTTEPISDLNNEMSQKEASDMVENIETISNNYQSYSSEKIAFAEEGNVVLFFKASWCPSCKALDDNINANIENIPENLLILDADYDTETVLKQKYGVTTQHTLVQIDAEGDMIQKWSGGSTLESIVSQI